MSGVRPVKAGWYNALRPWTLHGAVVPVLIGGAVALHDGSFNVAIFLLVLIGGCLLQSVANILNTYGDFRNGVDTEENETRSPELVTGVLKPESMLRAGILLIAVTCLIGLVLIWYSGWGILVYGVVGIAGAAMYTVGAAYKYMGLGQPFVFLLMGILMPLGTYYALASQFSWEVLLLSLPNAFLITAVLCGNEMRDHAEDAKAGVRTLCGHLGYGRGMALYRAESAVAFPLLIALILAGAAPACCALALVSLYDLWVLWRNSSVAEGDKHASFMLVPLAFKANWHFGVLLVAGYIIQYYAMPLVI